MSATAAAWCLAQVWREVPFRKRRLLLKVLQQYIIEHQAEICRYVSSSAPCISDTASCDRPAASTTKTPHTL